MDERVLIDQLEQAIERMIAHPQSGALPVDPELTVSVGLAGDLRDLPHPEFKKRLQLELERKAIMSTMKVDPVPAGYHTITAYLSVPRAAELIDWLKNAIGFTEQFRTTGSGGGIHCELRVGDSMLMVGGGPTLEKSNPTAFVLVTDKVDELYQRAVASGATSLGEPMDAPYGARVAGVKDLSGNEWYFSKALGDSTIHQGLGALSVYLHPVRTPEFIHFLKAAFGAEETQLYASADGVVQHAKILIGDSILQMGEAHGIYQPMPTQFYLYVTDCDAWYSRAIQAGARSVAEPVDHPYGDRSGAVEDPFGNVWYLATHIRDM